VESSHRLLHATDQQEGPAMARTRRTFGAIRKLPSGRFQASYAGPDLVRHKAPHTFTARMDAEAWLHKQRAAVEGDDWAPPTTRRPAALTVGDWAEAWLADRDLKPRTRAHYRYLLDRHILPTFGDLLVKAVTPAAVRTWHANLDTGPTAKAHAYALFKSIMGTAVEDEIIAANPCKIRGATRVKRAKRIEPATLDELTAIAERMPTRLRLIVPLSAWCALRFGEAAELRRRDFDLRAGVLRIRRGVVRAGGQVIVDTPKTDAGSRDVAVPPHLLPALKAHLRDHAQIGAEGLLFYGLKGGQLAHSSLRWHFTQAAEAAGRPDLTPHALRHTGAVLAARSGATLAELMARLGHTTPAMALVYQHAAEGRDAAIAARLSELASGGS